MNRAPHVAFVALLVAGCGNPPTADNVKWSVTRQGDAGYMAEVKANPHGGEEGTFVFDLGTIDERGCHAKYFLGLVTSINSNSDRVANIRENLETTGRIALATLYIRHHPFLVADNEVTPPIFSDNLIVDSRLNPPDFPMVPCSSRPKNDNEAIAKMPDREVVATAINTAGFLCAKVRDMYLSRRDIIVHCTEYRNGRGRAKYRVDTPNMTVERM